MAGMDENPYRSPGSYEKPKGPLRIGAAWAMLMLVACLSLSVLDHYLVANGITPERANDIGWAAMFAWILLFVTLGVFVSRIPQANRTLMRLFVPRPADARMGAWKRTADSVRWCRT